MIYKSIDTIPSKLYFKILETGDLTLLCVNEFHIPHHSKLEDIFSKIQEDDEKLTEKKGRSDEMDIWKKIESISARYKKIKYAIYYLRQMRDDDLEQLLVDDGYQFTDDFEGSLDEIERISESLPVKIESIKSRLPKKEKEDNQKEVPFDEAVLSYCALLGMGFVDTNTVVQSQYRAIIKMGNNKLEALSRNGRK